MKIYGKVMSIFKIYKQKGCCGTKWTELSETIPDDLKYIRYIEVYEISDNAFVAKESISGLKKELKNVLRSSGQLVVQAREPCRGCADKSQGKC